MSNERKTLLFVEFRDTYLANNPPGRAIADLERSIRPFFLAHRPAKRVAKVLLLPMAGVVYVIMKPDAGIWLIPPLFVMLLFFARTRQKKKTPAKRQL